MFAPSAPTAASCPTGSSPARPTKFRPIQPATFARERRVLHEHIPERRDRLLRDRRKFRRRVPPKACQALGLDGGFDGADLVRADRGVSITDDGTPPPAVPATGPRIGISVGVDRPWRFSVPDDPHRSKPW